LIQEEYFANDCVVSRIKRMKKSKIFLMMTPFYILKLYQEIAVVTFKGTSNNIKAGLFPSSPILKTA